MEWVGVYLHDAHQRFRDNITGDLDWTLSDTCMSGVPLCMQSANLQQTMPKRCVPTRPLLLASRIGVASSPTKNGKVTNTRSTLPSRLELVSHLPSAVPSASVRANNHSHP